MNTKAISAENYCKILEQSRVNEKFKTAIYYDQMIAYGIEEDMPLTIDSFSGKFSELRTIISDIEAKTFGAKDKYADIKLRKVSASQYCEVLDAATETGTYSIVNYRLALLKFATDLTLSDFDGNYASLDVLIGRIEKEQVGNS